MTVLFFSSARVFVDYAKEIEQWKIAVLEMNI